VRMPEGALSTTASNPTAPTAAAASRPARIELGEALFAPGTARLDADRAPVITTAAQSLVSRGGGRLQLSAAAGQEPLALQRAQVLREALRPQLPGPIATATTVEVLGADGRVLHRLRLDDPPEPDSPGRTIGEGR